MDYHCNSKFKTLQVHVQGRLLYNCHKAFPERVDIEWLESNPGKLFHTETMLNHRRQMLDNKPCSSCHHGCYKLEEQGQLSTRLLEMQDNEKKIADPQNEMETMQIMLATDCNLACVYCSPEFSTAWQREISKGGEYRLGEHTIDNDSFSLAWSKIKQKDRSTASKFFSLLLREIGLAKELKKIVLLGGEPLLSNQLPALTKVIHDQGIPELELVTGLGITEDRLNNFLESNKGKKIKFSISAESTNDFFEFIRYGTDWSSFKNKINTIKSYDHELRFISTISNISLFDFHNFYNQFAGQNKIAINLISGAPYLSPHVMDDRSKEKCKDNLEKIAEPKRRDILQNLVSKMPKDDERKMLGSYLRQLAKRRQLNLNFLPNHFLWWCGAID